jgi:hypothetical protein
VNRPSCLTRYRPTSANVCFVIGSEPCATESQKGLRRTPSSKRTAPTTFASSRKISRHWTVRTTSKDKEKSTPKKRPALGHLAQAKAKFTALRERYGLTSGKNITLHLLRAWIRPEPAGL